MATTTTYHCPKCGHGYWGEGRLGADYVCPCGCIIAASSADKVRIGYVTGAAVIVTVACGLAFSFLFLSLGAHFHIPWHYKYITLIPFPLVFYAIYKKFKMRNDCAWGKREAILLILLFLADVFLFFFWYSGIILGPPPF